MANVFLISERRKRLTPEKTLLFMDRLQILPIHIEEKPAYSILQEILNLARKFNLSAYDAEYLELAIRHRLPLASLDNDLIRAAKKIGIPILEESSFLGSN